MSKERVNKEELEYIQKYGCIPDEREDILKYLENNTRLDFQKIQEQEKYIKSIKWKELIISLPIIPKPSPRPRYNFKIGNFYVRGAADNKKIIQKYLDHCDIIYTRTDLLVETYQPTPSGMTNNEIYLAEKGLVLPISNPDWDNFGKTYSDMIQGLLLLNDNIVNPGSVMKYYSIKPRVKIHIKYQDGFDCNFNRKKILNSTGYLNMIKGGEIDERYTKEDCTTS